MDGWFCFRLRTVPFVSCSVSKRQLLLLCSALLVNPCSYSVCASLPQVWNSSNVFHRVIRLGGTPFARFYLRH
ncbi:hypothetical protein EDD15DRAFT_2236682 [Pisolithus albus]|nr:hypothetical protein EDD15DRAFT_2236682 [Pisolithus albus]